MPLHEGRLYRVLCKKVRPRDEKKERKEKIKKKRKRKGNCDEITKAIDQAHADPSRCLCVASWKDLAITFDFFHKKSEKKMGNIRRHGWPTSGTSRYTKCSECFHSFATRYDFIKGRNKRDRTAPACYGFFRLLPPS